MKRTTFAELVLWNLLLCEVLRILKVLWAFCGTLDTRGVLSALWQFRHLRYSRHVVVLWTPCGGLATCGTSGAHGTSWYFGHLALLWVL